MSSFTSKRLLSKLRKAKKNNGFTLIEMMAVVSIAGILSAIGLPALTKEIGKAQDSATIATLTNAAKNCSLSLITQGNDSIYLNPVTSKPFDGRFLNVSGTCATNGELTLERKGRDLDTTDNTRIAEVQFVGDVPQIAEFRTEVTSL